MLVEEKPFPTDKYSGPEGLVVNEGEDQQQKFWDGQGDMNRRVREKKRYKVLASCVLALVEVIGHRSLLRMDEQCV